MTLWKEGFTEIQDASGKQFAMVLAERLEANMRRLRLGGNDPIMVYPKSWREAVRIQRRNSQSEDRLISACLFGLAYVKEYHPYGRHIRHQLIKGRMERSAGGGVQFPVSLDI